MSLRIAFKKFNSGRGNAVKQISYPICANSLFLPFNSYILLNFVLEVIVQPNITLFLEHLCKLFVSLNLQATKK